MKRTLLLVLQSILFLLLFILPVKQLLASDLHKPDESGGEQPFVVENSIIASENTLPMSTQEETKERSLADAGTEGRVVNSFIEDVPGPGSFLGVWLQQLASASADSDGKIKNLIAGIPHFFPDLHRVLVAL